MKDSTVSGLMENRMSRNQKVRLRFFPAKFKDIYHYIRIMSSYILAQTTLLKSVRIRSYSGPYFPVF